MPKRRRKDILSPNSHSDVRIERYMFSLCKEIEIGKPLDFELDKAPDLTLSVQVAYVNCFDIFTVNWPWKVKTIESRYGIRYELEERRPYRKGERIVIPVSYNGDEIPIEDVTTLPKDFVPDRKFLFVISLQGPAIMPEE